VNLKLDGNLLNSWYSIEKNKKKHKVYKKKIEIEEKKFNEPLKKKEKVDSKNWICVQK
jgi:hypothetical protein